jgi:pSer/pThr/pTyr-binding forkhead associated (FHA) protein
LAEDTTVATHQPADNEQLFLLVVGDHVLATQELTGVGSVTIGRAGECDVRIDDASMSRVHAELRLGPPLSITDTRSANAPGSTASASLLTNRSSCASTRRSGSAPSR